MVPAEGSYLFYDHAVGLVVQCVVSKTFDEQHWGCVDRWATCFGMKDGALISRNLGETDDVVWLPADLRAGDTWEDEEGRRYRVESVGDRETAVGTLPQCIDLYTFYPAAVSWSDAPEELVETWCPERGVVEERKANASPTNPDRILLGHDSEIFDDECEWPSDWDEVRPTPVRSVTKERQDLADANLARPNALDSPCGATYDQLVRCDGKYAIIDRNAFVRGCEAQTAGAFPVGVLGGASLDVVRPCLSETSCDGFLGCAVEFARRGRVDSR